jgi:acid phosphatase type 7
MELDMQTQGASRSRPPRRRSQANPGVHPLSAMTARSQRFQPLPAPLGDPPYHYDLATAVPNVGKTTAKSLTFHVVGDTGGIKLGKPQRDVAAAMKQDLNLPAAQRPAFFYHLGDVVYYNGEIADYYDQFYDPYDYYEAPIIAIPGNHDGDPASDAQTSLDGWVAYFMTATPHVDPTSGDAPRTTMSLPNVYFTLNCPFVTIVGMYTNVPEHGSIDSVQQQWLSNELHTAPEDKALIVAMYHPIYSFDDHHSGSTRMADALQQAINDTGRLPNMVLAGHVHNYQRIERALTPQGPTPFIVSGNGGYFHLHGMQADDGTTDDQTGAKLIRSEHQHHGYVTLTVDQSSISGKVTVVDPITGAPSDLGDNFSYSAKALRMPSGGSVSL